MNTTANTIQHSIPDLIDHLFTNYGIIEQEDLEDETDKIASMNYDIEEPLTILFSTIEDLEQLAIAAFDPFTVKQLIDIGLKILKRCGDFTDALKAWYENPP